MARPESTARRKPRFRERSAAESEASAPAESSVAVSAGPVAAAFRPAPRTLALPTVTTEQVLYAVLIVGAFTLRIWDAGSRAMHGDEAVHAWFAWNLYNGSGYQYDPVYHGPLQFPVTALFFFLFGVSNLTGRLMAILFGTALVGLPFFLRHWMSRPAALVASGLIAISPAFVYTSRLERDDMFTCLFAMTMAIALFSFLHTRRVRYLYLGAASIALSLSAMENTYITLFVFGSFVLVALLSERMSGLPVFAPLVRLWRRSGTVNRIDASILLGYLALLFLAFVLTVVTGLYLPVPVVLGLGLLALVSRQVLLQSQHAGDAPFNESVRTPTRRQWINAVTLIVAILFLFFSTFGTNPHGIWDSSQSLINHGQCSYNSFPLNPCRKDIVGGLFYWLSQHNVHRGDQPWFYYTLLFGLYEQLVIAFGVAGIVWFARHPTLFTTFLTYWAVLMFGVYSWAGEKFPWLMVHPLLPFTLIAAMFIVQVLQRSHAVRWVAACALAVLLAIEVHSMYEVNFVNGADPVEMMVYVQSSPDTPRVASDILNISHKSTGGNDLHVTVDTQDTWPFAWYLRDMPNVGYPSTPGLYSPPFSTNPVIIVDESHQPALYPKIRNSYTGRKYRLRWWFPEDYKTLSWSSLGSDLTKPGYWNVVYKWLIDRRPFGPKESVNFYYYVKNGLVSPY
ncbi:MAG TPA: flippase activity-associated protein Agl23 [Chloroflexota bacterium]